MPPPKKPSARTLSESWLSLLAAELDPEPDAGAVALPLPGAELPWRDWLGRNFPHVASSPLAERHVRLWGWFDRLERGVKPRPRIEPWPRGGAKSTSGELGVVRAGAKLTRRHALIICEGQPQATDHVKTIAGHFERMGVGRAVNEYGASKGWKAHQLRTVHGFNVQGLGLDANLRGIRLDEFRPDLILFDDIDGRHDTPATIAKKIDIITQTILPAGSSDCAILFLQNLIHRHSIVSQLVKGTAGFLLNRETAEPEPAIRGMAVERYVREDTGLYGWRITAGTPTWPGQSVAVCEAQIEEWGLDAFLREAQQEVEEEEGGLWSRSILDDTRVVSHPPLIRIGVGVDPNTDEGGDEAGIIVAGVAKIAGVLHAFVLEDATVKGGPKYWSEAAVAAYNKYAADLLIAEKNNGGQMVTMTIKTVPGAPPVELVHASRGKITRAEPVQKLCADGRVHHVGRFELLETQLCTYKAGMPSPDRMDAYVWILTKLLLGTVPGAAVAGGSFGTPGQRVVTAQGRVGGLR